MTNIKKNERFIPLKNYIIAIGLVVVIIALTWYGFAWYNLKEEQKVSESYLAKEKVIFKELDLNEVSAVFSEPSAEYFVYISYTGDKEIYNMEKELKDVIQDYNLNENMYFLNVTSIKEEDDCIDQINKTLNLEEVKVKKIPTIIYFKAGKAVDIITRKDDNMMNKGDFAQLLEKNNIEK